MKNIYLFFGFFALILSVTLTSCGDGNLCYIDNPTDKELSITLDEQTMSIAPFETKKMKLSSGTHSLKLKNGDGKKFEITEKSLINPTESTYCIETVVYGQGATANKTVVIDDYEFEGNVTIHSDIIIPIGKVDLFLNTPFPSEVTTSRGGVSKKMTKIFRKADFLKEYTE